MNQYLNLKLAAYNLETGKFKRLEIGKDFVVLPTSNRKQRRSYKYVSQPSHGIKQIDQNKKVVSLYDEDNNKHF